jgi:hypothetical protein
MKRDDKGIVRLQLNNKDLSIRPSTGMVPTDSIQHLAMEARNNMCENQETWVHMIRKHVKVEPARWYHTATVTHNRMADMPNGDRALNGRCESSSDGVKGCVPRSEANFRKE